MLDMNKRVSQEESERIIQGALRLAENYRIENVNAKTIEDSLSMESGEVLRVFPDIKILWRAVLTRIEGRLMALLEHTAEYEHNVDAALESMFKCHISFISHHLGVVRIVFHSLHVDDNRLKRQIQNILRRYKADIVNMICLGKAEGTIRDEVDAPAAAIHFIALIQGLAVRMLVLSRRDRDVVLDEAQQVITLYLDGIRVRPVGDAR